MSGPVSPVERVRMQDMGWWMCSDEQTALDPGFRPFGLALVSGRFLGCTRTVAPYCWRPKALCTVSTALDSNTLIDARCKMQDDVPPADPV